MEINTDSECKWLNETLSFIELSLTVTVSHLVSHSLIHADTHTHESQPTQWHTDTEHENRFRRLW